MILLILDFSFEDFILHFLEILISGGGRCQFVPIGGG